MGISFKTKKKQPKTAKSRYFTPPLDLRHKKGSHLHPSTPLSASLWTLKVLEERYNMKIT